MADSHHTLQRVPWVKAGLPGRPVIEEGKALTDIAPGRVIRGRDGKAITFADSLDAAAVASLAGEFLGRDIRRVFFIRKNGDRQRQFALAQPSGVVLARAETLVVEAFTWMRARETGRGKKKVRLTEA